MVYAIFGQTGSMNCWLSWGIVTDEIISERVSGWPIEGLAIFPGGQPAAPVTQTSCLHRPESGVLGSATEQGRQRLVPSKRARDAAKIGMIPGRQKILPHPPIEDLSQIAMRWAGFFIYF